MAVGGRTCPRRREVRYLTSIPTSSPTSNQMVSGDHISKPLSHTVLLMNARSVQNKTALIHDVILDEGADLACITETWVGEEGGVPLSQLCLPGYSVQHQCHSEGWEGELL